MLILSSVYNKHHFNNVYYNLLFVFLMSQKCENNPLNLKFLAKSSLIDIEL